MPINNFLYNDAYEQIKIFRVRNPEADHEAWELEPVVADVLAPGQESDLNAVFVMKALLVADNAAPVQVYMDIFLPERTCENIYLSVDDEIVQESRWEIDADVIPQAAINFAGEYELFYSRQHPEIGIEVLRKGLDTVRERSAIALDLAYILRDEGRAQESIEAFSEAIEGKTTDYFPFIERAQLLDKIGKRDMADPDWEMVGKLAGSEVVEMYRSV